MSEKNLAVSTDYNYIFLKAQAIGQKLNFEFMDISTIPNSLRSTLRDILEVCNKKPFRTYHDWVATSIYEYAKSNQIDEIIELGAGCAPITRHLSKAYPNWDIIFKITDLNPDKMHFAELENSDSRVEAIYASIDFSKKIPATKKSLLVLSTTFHHIPENLKIAVIENLKATSSHVLIFESLRPNVFSFALCFDGFLAGFITPLFRIGHKSFSRCLFWCWLCPVAPAMLMWDGWVSVIRMWNKKQWLEIGAKANETIFCTKVQI